MSDLRDALTALVRNDTADKYRREATRHMVDQPYADNRYVRLLDDLRAILAAHPAPPVTVSKRHSDITDAMIERAARASNWSLFQDKHGWRGRIPAPVMQARAHARDNARAALVAALTEDGAE